MDSKLIEFGGPVEGQMDNGPILLFVHANGYPPGSYRQFLEPMKRYFRVFAAQHRPLWAGRQPPERVDWTCFADDLQDAIDQISADSVHLVGHSMGAVAALQLAATRPGKVTTLTLLDPVFNSDWNLLKFRLTPRSKLLENPLVRGALRRPEYFPDQQGAFRFYRTKRAFANFDDSALWDYVDASNEPCSDGRVRLRFSGAWEAAIYRSSPRVVPWLKKLRVPTLGLRGTDSYILTEEFCRNWQRWQPEARIENIEGGHLFPMECPEATADAVRSFLFAR
ncbi:MAG: alpha/beta hydrolase [Pseudomonadota bacterium]